MTELNKARRRGRPRLGPEEGKRYPIGIRTTKELNDLLKAAADSSGRSIAQEIELRLEQSLAQGAFPREVEALAELLARVMHQTGEAICAGGMLLGARGSDWHDDPYAYDQAAKAALFILRAARPEGSRQPSGLFAAIGGHPTLPRNLAQNVGRGIAAGVLAAIDGRQSGVALASWARARGIGERLGSIAGRLFRRSSDDQSNGHMILRAGP